MELGLADRHLERKRSFCLWRCSSPHKATLCISLSGFHTFPFPTCYGLVGQFRLSERVSESKEVIAPKRSWPNNQCRATTVPDLTL